MTGQLRVDDPNSEPPQGIGDNLFIDRGAIDRSDFAGPSAGLVKPRDDDADGKDQKNPDIGIVQLLPGPIPFRRVFAFACRDGVQPADPINGTGVDDDTVTSSSVTVTRNDVLLKDNIDYSFSYNKTSDTIELVPLSGIWPPDSVYVVTLHNSDRFIIDAPAGDRDRGRQCIYRHGFSRCTDRFEFESGYTLRVPKTRILQVPEAGGRLGGIRDGETFSVQFRTSSGTNKTRYL